MADKIALFVGCAPDGADAESQAVLEYTARRNTNGPLQITWMALSRDPASPWSGWRTSHWVTAFTGFRWAIPEVCGFRGRAIYMDSDMIVRADLRELWETPIPKGAFALARVDGAKLRTCVMLLDCKAARSFLPPLAEMRTMKNPLGAIDRTGFAPMDPFWNCVDLRGCKRASDPRVKVLHYSEMSTQPHLAMARERLARRGRTHWYDGPIAPHPRPEVPAEFAEMLAHAVFSGYRPENYEPTEPYRPFEPYGDYKKRSLARKPLKGFR